MRWRGKLGMRVGEESERMLYSTGFANDDFVICEANRKSATQGVAPGISKKENAGAISADFRHNLLEYFYVDHYARNAGSRRSFRTPNPLLGPQDGPVHLRPPQPYSHHQPGKIAADVPGGDEVRQAAVRQPRHHP